MIDQNIINTLQQQKHLNQHYLNRYIYLISRWSTIDFGNVRTELHHIIPRSWGGTDVAQNLIRLPIKHHVVAHHILARTGDVHMQNAFNIIVGNHAHLFNYNQTIQMIADSRRMIVEAKNKPVINLDTGEIYPSITEASLALGLGPMAVKDGIKECYRVGGYCWAHVEDLQKCTCEQLLERYNTNRRKIRAVREANDNLTFESLTAAAKYYQLDANVLHNSLKKNMKCGGHKFEYVDPPHKPRKVRNVDTGEVYQTVCYAGRAIGVKHAQIINAIHRKTRCRGYYWEYIDE